MPEAKPSKREVTRQRVIQAAIDTIFDSGFHAANTNRIAAAAGVSWGVLQYHFGDKDGLLEAVLECIFEDFSTALQEANLAGTTLDERISELIELVWSLVSKKEYRVSIAILRNAGKDASSSINGQRYIDEWSQRVSRLWDNTFTDVKLSRARSQSARKLMFAALRGMADEINPAERSVKALREQRHALAYAISRLLQDHKRPN
ncbi:MAG: TetR/AcrR family transcriptional regulator [Gammaproteobacteria bacterium]|nr:TetR/AcrR family transcriptional regulator [Gammaproteobacteria bacterium]